MKRGAGRRSTTAVFGLEEYSMTKTLCGVIALGVCAALATTMNEPQAFAVPPIKKAISKTTKIKLQYKGSKALSVAQKLAFLKDSAKDEGVAPPTGLDAPVKLSARSMFVAGKADLNAHCARSVDALADEIIPILWVNPYAGGTKPCNWGGSQGIDVRFGVTQVNKPVLLDVVLSATVMSSVLMWDPTGTGTRLNLILAGGETGHFMFMAVPKKTGWFTAQLQLVNGDVKIKSVEISQTH